MDISKVVLVYVWFSIVVGFWGSVDIVCDVCGFVIRFYMDEGNWDIGKLFFFMFLIIYY